MSPWSLRAEGSLVPSTTHLLAASIRYAYIWCSCIFQALVANIHAMVHSSYSFFLGYVNFSGNFSSFSLILSFKRCSFWWYLPMATENKVRLRDEACFVSIGKWTEWFAEAAGITSLRFEKLSANSLEYVFWVKKAIRTMLMWCRN